MQLLNNLGLLYANSFRGNEAIEMFERALSVSRTNFGKSHVSNINILNNIGTLNEKIGNYSKAEKYYRQAYEVSLKYFGENHIKSVLPLHNIAEVSMKKNEYEKSLQYFRQSSEISKNFMQTDENEEKKFMQNKEISEGFVFHLVLLSKPYFNKDDEIGTVKYDEVFKEGFELGQYSRVSKTSSALKKMSARFSTSDPLLADLVREYQNSIKKLNLLQNKLEISLGSLSKDRNKDDELVLRNKIANVNKKVSETHRIIESRFPKYFQLTQQRSVDLASIQSILKKNEALISYLSTDSNLFVWAINSKSFIFRRIEMTSEVLKQKTSFLRNSASSISASFTFDKSYELYMDIIKPIESIIKDVKHLNIVTDRSLQSIPFSMLLTNKGHISYLSNSNLQVDSSTRGISGVAKAIDKSADSKKYDIYRNADWLMNKYSISYFPSIPSLKYLRDNKKEKASNSNGNKFIGFGNPSIGNVFAKDKEPVIENNNFIASLNMRGMSFDQNQIVKLPELPETANELLSISKILGSSSKNVILGQDATETNLKELDLTKYSIIAFATHGLMANEIAGVDEPSLVLTPPSEPTVLDDGLLTSGEISQLKLNADWVILSACNTAASDGTPGAEGFSGLTKSFFYAGARSLLVSHWPVASEATVELTTNMFEEMRIDPDLGKSEALRRSRLKLINDSNNPEYAHPVYWAPFVVVGEGNSMK